MSFPADPGPASDETKGERTTRLHNALVVEELVAANNSSNKTMLALVEQVRKETEARDRKIAVLEKNTKQARLLSFLVGGAVVVLLALAVTNAFNIAAGQRQQRQVQQINATLLDCVNSTGQCGRQNALGQEQVLNEVKKYNLVGFYCIRLNPATADPKAENFLKCMERLYPGGPTLAGR